MLLDVKKILKNFKDKTINVVNCYSFFMPNGISRIINFFRVNFTHRGVPINVEQLFTHIHELPYTEDGRFSQVGEGDFLSVSIDATENPIKFHFGIVRTKGLPLIEESGLPPHPFELAENAGFYEPMHVVLFDHGIAGAEYNHHAPRLPRLHEYLISKFPDRVDNVEVIPLIKPGVESEIARMGEIKVLKLKLNKDIVALSRGLDQNVFDALESMRSIHDQIEDFEIVLRAKPRHSFSWDSIKQNIPRWLNNSDVQTGVETFQMTAIDNDICAARKFDLLQNYIRTDKRVVQLNPRNRCVDSASMYSKIIEAYNELRPDIDRIMNTG